MINLAERQKQCENELSDDRNKSWETLRSKAETELKKIQKPSWWQKVNFNYWFTFAFTACGFVISIAVKESVSGYTKHKLGEVLQKPESQNSTTG